jgi:predicted  nucleic acid-binding Zn-ribbon protein
VENQSRAREPAVDVGKRTRVREERGELKRQEAKDRQRRHEALKGFKERLGTVEQEIARLESRIKEIEAALVDPELYRDGARARETTREHKALQERIAWLYDEWASLDQTLSNS